MFFHVTFHVVLQKKMLKKYLCLNSQIVFIKGHALAEKAGARTDFSYVPGHLGEF